MLLLTASAKPQMPVHNIDTGIDYATIQEAIIAKETLNGHTIYVDAGTYHENLVVNRSISLIGKDKSNTTIIGLAPPNIIYVTANNVKIAQFTIQESAYGYSSVYLYCSKGSNITDNILRNSYYGVQLYNSTNNSIYENLIKDCEYGIRYYNSTGNILSKNTVTNNKNGIHIDISNNNNIFENNITLNQWNGIYLFHSSNNTISDNTLTLNGARGIRLNDSTNNTISKNTVSKNEHGFDLYESNKNNIHLNIVSNNTDGIWLMESSQNIICANTVSNNSQYGLRLLNSSYNKVFHNNFINNTLKSVEQPSDTSIANLWDNFFEGNYWIDHKGNDTNKDGIIDTPYIIDQRTWLGIHSMDNYPLIGTFQHLNLQFNNQSYSIEIVSNSTIADAQYNPDPENEENKLILKLINPQNASFCRISIPHALVKPPYSITLNNNSPTHNNTIRTNGTHTWIYFEYNNTQHATTITLMHKVTPIPQPPIWTQWPFWEVVGLTALAVILSLFNIKNHLTIKRQKNLIHLYEEKLKKADPLVIARELFTADVQSRQIKIAKFEDKYGLKIQPHNTLEDIIRSIKSKRKESEN